jgi:hypothetical protein
MAAHIRLQHWQWRISRDDHDGQTAVGNISSEVFFPAGKITYPSKTGMVAYKSGITRRKVKRGKKIMRSLQMALSHKNYSLNVIIKVSTTTSAAI